MKRFIEGEADRSQSVSRTAGGLDRRRQSGSGGRCLRRRARSGGAGIRGRGAALTRTAGIPPGDAPQDLHLWVSEPDPVQPSAGARDATQRRTDVADRSTGARLQDHRRLPSGQRRSDSPSLPRVHRAVSPDRAVWRAVVAIDGSKFKAVNNRDKNFTPHKLKARMQQLEESIARYLNDLDRADRDPTSVPAVRVTHLKEKIATVRAADPQVAAHRKAVAGGSRSASLAH